MIRRPLITFIASLLVVLVPATAADAAKRKAVAYPTVTKITPMQVAAGDTVTISGKHFLRGKGRNTVVLRRDGKRSLFVKADGLSTTRLRLTVPAKIETMLGKPDGVVVPTRFRVRILARRFGRTYTALKRSPVIVPRNAAGAGAGAGTAATAPAPPADCDGDGLLDNVDPHDDDDLLDDATEARIGTNRCLADTDGDGMQDGWEYKAAVDLNQPSCPSGIAQYPLPCTPVLPYPGKKPYPNPLDGGDAGTDYDGDWLTSGDEHRAWVRHNPRTLETMWYSDGLQASQDSTTADSCVGVTAPAPLGDASLVGNPDYAVYSLDRFGRDGGDGCLMDAERDEDGDYLTNVDELAGALSSAEWWKAVYDGEENYRVSYAGTDWLDTDSDGDGTADGKDDQDHDDFWNVEEIVRTDASTGIAGLWVHAFNPCLPAINSRTCPPATPASGSVWAPFYRTTPLTKNWPLWRDNVAGSGYALFSGVAVGSQSLPPVHPLPRP